MEFLLQYKMQSTFLEPADSLVSLNCYSPTYTTSLALIGSGLYYNLIIHYQDSF